MATKTIDPTLYERAASLGLDLLPSTPTIGAEVSGLDLDGPLNVTQAEWLHDAWIAHKVLFFRHQDISYESHVRLGRLFGELEGHPVIPHVERSEEHTSELQSLMRISYAVFCLKKNKKSN